MVFEREQYISFSINGGEIISLNTVREPERQFFTSPQANAEATDHVKIADYSLPCKKDLNELIFYAASPAILL